VVFSVEEASSRRQIERFVFEAAPRPSTIALPSTARGRFRAAPRPAVLRTVRVCVVAVLRRLCCMLDRSLVPHATHMSLISEAASSGGHRSYGAALKSPGAPNPALNVQRVARPLPPSDPSVLPIWCCNAISSTGQRSDIADLRRRAPPPSSQAGTSCAVVASSEEGLEDGLRQALLKITVVDSVLPRLSTKVFSPHARGGARPVSAARPAHRGCSGLCSRCPSRPERTLLEVDAEEGGFAGRDILGVRSCP